MTFQRDNYKDLTKTISVDSQNRITQVQDALSTTIGNYWYDEGGFRVRKKALVPSGAGFKNQEILYPSKFYGLEYAEDTNILSSINNVYLNGVRIAALNEEGTAAYFLTDQVDSVAHVLDEGAHTLSRMQYEPYGETLVQRGTLDFAPKYNSQELDRETNFYFYNARYYDPQIARFTSADSVVDGVSDTQGWNRFSYVAGNPILYEDPTGHEAGLGGLGLMLSRQCANSANKSACMQSGGDAFSEGAVEGAKATPSLVLGAVAAYVIVAEAVAITTAAILPAAALYLNPNMTSSLINTFQQSSAILGESPAVFDRLKNRGGLNLPSKDKSQLLLPVDGVPNAGGAIRSFVQKDEKIYYRVFDKNAEGSYLTSVRPKSRAYAEKALALPRKNKAKFIQEVRVPAGTRLQRSRAAKAFGQPGGGEQFRILNRNEIPKENYGPGNKLK